MSTVEATAPDGDDLQQMLERQRREKRLVYGLRLLILVGALTIWELGSGDPRTEFVLIDEYFVSKPSAMLATAQEWVERGELWTNLLATVQVTLLGFLFGAIGGVALGFALGVSRFWSRVLTPFVSTLYSIPRLALIPLFLLWFGLGLGAKLALVIVIVFFLIFYNTFSGVRDVDAGLVDVMRVMSAKSWQIHLKVTFPSAMVWIATGLRISVPYALVATVTGEMLMSNTGMGYVIIRSAGQFNTAGVFAGILVLMVMALIFTGLVGLLESVVLGWKAQERQPVGAGL